MGCRCEDALAACVGLPRFGSLQSAPTLPTMQAEHRVKEAARTEKQLDELRGRWEALKRAGPQVGMQVGIGKQVF